ncbi:hypothetical protein FRB97_003055 [Tulasnella sp. 331]|nr:hypothetical protein FRB97_003055 [Tulasnella sp. 331]
MSYAVVQGCSKGLGRALAQLLLKETKLHVVGTTASGASNAKESILSGQDSSIEDRLTTLDMDVCDERAIEKVAHSVKDRFGQELRLLVNVSGVLHAEKSLSAVKYETMERSFKINTFGHLMVYKYFLPLIPTKKKKPGERTPDEDGNLLKDGRSLLVSLSARVGSIGDNDRGGWYSYRSSKAATNQVVRTLARELSHRSQCPAIAIAYHPGTASLRHHRLFSHLKTDLSAPYIQGQTPENTKGLFEVEEAALNLLKVLEGLKPEESGSFKAYDGSPVPW